MPNKPVRYFIDVSKGIIEPDTDGMWVGVEDYDALARETEKLRLEEEIDTKAQVLQDQVWVLRREKAALEQEIENRKTTLGELIREVHKAEREAAFGPQEAAMEIDPRWGVLSSTGRSFVRQMAHRVLEVERERDQAQADLAACRGHVRMALDELGVPGPGYPAPVANAVEHLNEAMKPDVVGTALLQERDNLLMRLAESERDHQSLVESLIPYCIPDNETNMPEHPSVAMERMKRKHDHLRALLMLAYDTFVDEFPGRTLLQQIADAVSPVGQVTEADIRWAGQHLDKKGN